MLPNQYHNSRFRTPQYFYGLPSEHKNVSKITNNSTDVDNDPTTLTCIQIGNSEPAPFIQLCNNKIPELPSKTRSRASNNNLSRPSTAITYTYQNNDTKQTPGLTMKYFGESGNVIGCFTSAKIPIKMQRPSTAIRPRTGSIYSTPRQEETYRRFNGYSPLKQ